MYINMKNIRVTYKHFCSKILTEIHDVPKLALLKRFG